LSVGCAADARHRRGLYVLARGQLAERERPLAVERGQRGDLRRRQPVVGALLAEPPAEPHDGHPQLAGERRVKGCSHDR
jgi:hypothetical protein